MASNRKLINYLPQFMRDYREMNNIMEAEQHEFDLAWERAENALSDQFILEATEYGVIRWESMLGITPKDTDDLKERRFRILAKMNQELPYTLTKLKEALTALCGADGFAIDLQPEKYKIEIKLALGNSNNLQEVTNLLVKMIPANMIQHVQIMYNTHAIFSALKFRHNYFADNKYTHEQLRSSEELRNEVLTNAE